MYSGSNPLPELREQIAFLKTMKAKTHNDYEKDMFQRIILDMEHQEFALRTLFESQSDEITLEELKVSGEGDSYHD